MADITILSDTSILLDYFRKTDKANSRWIVLFDQGYGFSISAITHYEIYSGATSGQLSFWESVLNRTAVIPFNKIVAQAAVDINNSLKRKRKQIEMADLFIAATAISSNLPFATLNKKHFDRVDGCALWNKANAHFQLVSFAGVDKPISFLQVQAGNDAKEALEYVLECLKAGDFDDLERYFKETPWWIR